MSVTFCSMCLAPIEDSIEAVVCYFLFWCSALIDDSMRAIQVGILGARSEFASQVPLSLEMLEILFYVLFFL